MSSSKAQYIGEDTEVLTKYDVYDVVSKDDYWVAVSVPWKGTCVTRRINFNFDMYEGPLINKPKIASDGGSTRYYDLPKGAKTLYDLIEAQKMNFSEGNVFKAVFRMGKKEGVDLLYDWNKIKFCAEREIARIKREQDK